MIFIFTNLNNSICVFLAIWRFPWKRFVITNIKWIIRSLFRMSCCRIKITNRCNTIALQIGSYWRHGYPMDAVFMNLLAPVKSILCNNILQLIVSKLTKQKLSTILHFFSTPEQQPDRFLGYPFRFRLYAFKNDKTSKSFF